MKQKIVLWLTPLLTIASLSVSSAIAKEQQHDLTAPSQQREQYEKSMEERLGKLGRQLDELKAQAEIMTEQARKETNRYIADADKKQKKAFRKLDDMRKKSEQEWKKFSSEMNQALHDFEKAYERAKSHFKE